MAELTKEGYREHLIDIRNKINDFIALIDNGKSEYLTDVALKLRILYLKKSGTPPLLQSIQDLFQFEFSVWDSKSLTEAIENGELPAGFPKPAVEIHIGPLHWFAELRRQKTRTNLLLAFERDRMIFIDGHEYSVKKIIEVIADKMGGAHIDKSVKDSDLVPHSKQFLIGGLTVADKAVYDTAKQTIKVIDLIIEFINSGVENEYITVKNLA